MRLRAPQAGARLARTALASAKQAIAGLLTLATLGQCAVLVTHLHSALPAATGGRDFAHADQLDAAHAWASSQRHEMPAAPADPDPHDPSCEVCAALSLCRVSAVGPEAQLPGRIRESHRQPAADAPIVPAAPEATGPGARSPPLSLV